MAEHWYDAKKTEGRFQGRVYHYNEMGNNMIVDYLSDKKYITEGEAIDDASIWCEEANINAEIY